MAHVGLTVPDIDAAIDWYRNVLGFTVSSPPATFEPDDDHVGELLTDALGEFEQLTIAHLSTSSGVAVEFLEFAETEERASIEPQRAGWAHLCLVDPDVEELAGRIDEQGGDHYADVWEIFPDEEYELTYCEDPFGNKLEIYSHSDEQIYANRS
ncbi:glyoxalase [Natrarchaeobius chitinivorans]|uniref:Glyoxalase n=2 Tax=Natrarchaeobius chitinivorans TaxID=1679083 RepID=A0A3N6LW97_NATCH|nr:glyoxalase [Natrarchaeobius chitinivorans]